METQKRRAIALIAGNLISKSHSNVIYDFVSGTSHSFDVDIKANYVNVHDYDRLNSLTGTSSDGNNYLISDYASNSSIELQVKNFHFKGFDNETSSKFEGNVGGKLITLYDDQDKENYNFRI